MTLVDAMPESEGAVRTWLRSLNLDTIGRNWFFGQPRQGTPTYWGEVKRVGGTIDEYLPVDDAEMQIDVIGQGDEKTNVKGPTAAIATAVVAQIRALQAGTDVGAGVRCDGARVTLGPLPRPEDDRFLFRYVIGARFTLVASG